MGKDRLRKRERFFIISFTPQIPTPIADGSSQCQSSAWFPVPVEGPCCLSCPLLGYALAAEGRRQASNQALQYEAWAFPMGACLLCHNACSTCIASSVFSSFFFHLFFSPHRTILPHYLPDRSSQIPKSTSECFLLDLVCCWGPQHLQSFLPCRCYLVLIRNLCFCWVSPSYHSLFSSFR